METRGLSAPKNGPSLVSAGLSENNWSYPTTSTLSVLFTQAMACGKCCQVQQRRRKGKGEKKGEKSSPSPQQDLRANTRVTA